MYDKKVKVVKPQRKWVIFLDYSRQTKHFKNREGEPFEVMLRRFFRDVQQSGILTEIKRRRFRDRDISRKLLRQAARRKAARKKIKRGY